MRGVIQSCLIVLNVKTKIFSLLWKPPAHYIGKITIQKIKKLLIEFRIQDPHKNEAKVTEEILDMKNEDEDDELENTITSKDTDDLEKSSVPDWLEAELKDAETEDNIKKKKLKRRRKKKHNQEHQANHPHSVNNDDDERYYTKHKL